MKKKCLKTSSIIKVWKCNSMWSEFYLGSNLVEHFRSVLHIERNTMLWLIEQKFQQLESLIFQAEMLAGNLQQHTG